MSFPIQWLSDILRSPKHLVKVSVSLSAPMHDPSVPGCFVVACSQKL